MIQKFRYILLASTIILFSGCGSNPYMKLDTPQYNTTTKKLQGIWSVKSYKIDDFEFIQNKYEDGKLHLNFTTKKAKFTFSIKKENLQSSLQQWRKTWSDLAVSKYDVIVTASWILTQPNSIGKTVWGDLALRLFDIKHTLDIKGSGENFKEEFLPIEELKFKTTKILGVVGNMIVDELDKTGGINPIIPNGFKVIKLSENYIELKTNHLVTPTKSLILVR